MSLTIRPFITGYALAYAVTDKDSGRTILVDSGAGKGAERLRKSLGNAGADPGDVSLIVLTHAHSDHIAGLAELKTLTGAPLMTTAATAAALAEGRDEEIIPRTRAGRFLTGFTSRRGAGSYPPITAEHIITEETSLRPFGVAAAAIPTPGHTAGSLSLLTGDGHAIIGDLVMKFVPGRPGLSFLSNDEEQLIGSLRLLLDLNVEVFHLAHGGTIDRRAVEDALGRTAR